MRRSLLISLLLVLLGSPVSAQTIDETLVRVRAKYPALVTAEQAAAILNETAWVHRADGWAILGKPGGTNCPQPTTAIPISCDFLIHRINGIWWGWDALIGTGKPGQPGPASPNTPIGQGEDMSEAIKAGARSVVPPVDPGTPTPDPPDPPACDACADLAALQASVSRLGAAIAALTEQLRQLDARVTTLEAAPPAPPATVVCEEIKATTGRTWSHAHPIAVWKCEVK